MVNYFVLRNDSRIGHLQWADRTKKAVSTTLPNNKVRTVLIDEWRLFQVRMFTEDEEKFVASQKTYNNMHHVNGNGFRSWNPLLNLVFYFFQNILGLGGIPKTMANPAHVDGHAIILARVPDKRNADGSEAR